MYMSNKFPMPLSNRHACYTSAACRSTGSDGVTRWLYCEQSVKHESLALHDESTWSSPLQEWRFTNTMVLEPAGDDVLMTVCSKFDIGGFMPPAARHAAPEA